MAALRRLFCRVTPRPAREIEEATKRFNAAADDLKAAIAERAPPGSEIVGELVRIVGGNDGKERGP